MSAYSESRKTHRNNGLGYWLKVNQGKHTEIMD